MKKKILGVTFIVTLAVVAALNVNLNKSNTKVDLAMANVEALAGGETYQFLCAGTEPLICVLYEDGHMEYGRRVY